MDCVHRSVCIFIGGCDGVGCVDSSMVHAGPQQATSNAASEGSDQDEVVPPRGGQAELTAEQGLKHLLLTVDVERLYRSAVPVMPCTRASSQ